MCGTCAIRNGDPRLVEVTSLPTYYIDGIAQVHILGPVTKLLGFEFRPANGELVMMPVMEIIRPTANDIPASVTAMMRTEAKRTASPCFECKAVHH